MACHVRRGHGGMRLQTPNFCTVGNTDDLHNAVLTVAERYPNAPIFLVGLSAGTNSVIRYAGELEHPRFKRADTAQNVAGVVAIGAGFELPTAWDNCESPYDRIILSKVKSFFVAENHDILEDFNSEQCRRAMESKSLNEFNKAAALLCGFDSYAEFNDRINTMAVATYIRVPLLILNANDDPLCVSANITNNVQETFRSNEKSILVVTPFGGHLGWFEGWNGMRWHARAATEFVQAVVAGRCVTA